MRKRLLSLTLAVLLLLTSGAVCGCGGEPVASADHLEDYVQTMEYKDGFTILQLTDIHWSSASQTGDETYGCERYIRKVIAEAEAHAGHIDLIEITGDTFMLTDARSVKKFIDMMADIGIPYAMTWGNHDRESTYNPNWISAQFVDAPCSLYTELDNDDVHERGNYVIDLMNPDGSVAWQIVNLDSGANYREGAGDLGLDYDWIREDQLDWMTAEHDRVGASVPVIAYYHIAQQDNDKAFEAVQSGAEGYKSKFFKLESFDPSTHAGSTEEVFLHNNVKAAFMGHAHAIDWTVTLPSGITYGLGVKTCAELYYGIAEAGYPDAGFDVTETFDVLGASLVTLNDTGGGFTLEHLYLNERSGGDFVLWVTY